MNVKIDSLFQILEAKINSGSIVVSGRMEHSVYSNQLGKLDKKTNTKASHLTFQIPHWSLDFKDVHIRINFK
jgi:hypothetical protein